MDYCKFLRDAQAFGLLVDELAIDEQIHRVPTQEKPRAKNGWYIGFPNSGAVLVGDWATGGQLFITGSRSKRLTEAEKRTLQQVMAKEAALRQQHQLEAAKRARALYGKATPATYHPYLERKAVVAVAGMRVLGETLVIPMFDAINSDIITSLQFIDADGSKRFLSKGRISQSCFPIGLRAQTENNTIYIAEGVATAISVHLLTGSAVIAAFNATNLTAVARIVKHMMPAAEIIIAADDDASTQHRMGINPGKHHATKAAKAVGGKVTLPPFSRSQRRDGLTDWNDYWCFLQRQQGGHYAKGK
ncbi:toprim domain-containing protein [Shewanella cyperi]|uniref:Toprim domain-containing protein n=1 Tax=Shewanella cyperi TaxID=2814292 RepID=A0A974XHM8_9GAMM|nr:toprim domain-containing protein [Shewanella cyperi]QSX28582.1 toprim domain-containing protein [Shewanella cyperi]